MHENHVFADTNQTIDASLKFAAARAAQRNNARAQSMRHELSSIANAALQAAQAAAAAAATPTKEVRPPFPVRDALKKLSYLINTKWVTSQNPIDECQ